MNETQILDCQSLAATLWNLEEARIAGRLRSEPEVKKALDWIASRQGLPMSYHVSLFAPTNLDMQERRSTPTGEDGSVGRGGVMHILGEEAVRELKLWNHNTGWDSGKALDTIVEFGRGNPPGRFCCHRCSVARWRALAAAKPAGWEEALAASLQLLHANIDGEGKLNKFPYYYALLSLSEMPMPESESVRARLKPNAERRLARLKGDDQATRFRRRALELTLAE